MAMSADQVKVSPLALFCLRLQLYAQEDIGDAARIQLWVKASYLNSDHRSPCLFCQKWFTALYLKSEVKELVLTAIPVNMTTPPNEFKQFASQPPILTHDGIALTDNLKIEKYIYDTFQELDLHSTKEAEDVCSDLYSKFHHYLQATREQSDARKRLLLGELRRINEFYQRLGTTFLSGDRMTIVDCETLPKLHHIRIAGKAYKDFDIPTEFAHLRHYLTNGYKTRAFQEGCPSDQEIILHYEKKFGQSLIKHPTLQTQTYSWSVQ